MKIGQVLTGLKMLLETSSRLPADTLRSRLSNAQSLVEQLMEQVQGMSLDLRPTMLDDLGLLPAAPLACEALCRPNRRPRQSRTFGARPTLCA